MVEFALDNNTYHETVASTCRVDSRDDNDNDSSSSTDDSSNSSEERRKYQKLKDAVKASNVIKRKAVERLMKRLHGNGGSSVRGSSSSSMSMYTTQTGSMSKVVLLETHDNDNDNEINVVMTKNDDDDDNNQEKECQETQRDGGGDGGDDGGIDDKGDDNNQEQEQQQQQQQDDTDNDGIPSIPCVSSSLTDNSSCYSGSSHTKHTIGRPKNAKTILNTFGGLYNEPLKIPKGELDDVSVATIELVFDLMMCYPTENITVDDWTRWD
jgi:hypothetical protein